MTMNASKKSTISKSEHTGSAKPNPESVAKKPMRIVKSAPKPGSISRAAIRKAIDAIMLAREK